MKWERIKSRIKAICERLKDTANSLADSHRMLGTMCLLILEFGKKELSQKSVNFVYFAFIAVFPLDLIITSVMGFLLHASPGLEADITSAVYEMFPDFDMAFKGMPHMVESGRFVFL